MVELELAQDYGLYRFLYFEADVLCCCGLVVILSKLLEEKREESYVVVGSVLVGVWLLLGRGLVRLQMSGSELLMS